MLELEGPCCSTVRRRVRPKQSGPPKPGYPASAVCRLREVLCAGEKARMGQHSGIGQTYHASQYLCERPLSVSSSESSEGRGTRPEANAILHEYTLIYWRCLGAPGTMRTETKQGWTQAHR